MVAAGVGAKGVNRALAAVLPKKMAVAIGHPAEGKQAVLVVEMFDDTAFFKASGKKFWFFLAVEFGDHPKADQIADPHLDRQATTTGGTTFTELLRKFMPSGSVVNIDWGEGDVHQKKEGRGGSGGPGGYEQTGQRGGRIGQQPQPEGVLPVILANQLLMM